MKVAILGCGLMGSSLAAALRRRDLASRVVGYDLDPDTGARAMRLGLIDATAASAAQAVQDADLVVLAAPVGAMPQLLEHIAAGLGPSALVTDLGSTKADVMAAAREALGAAFARFVPAHPIAGGERTGPEGADPDLFEGCTVVITAASETRADALARIEQLWRSCGARVAQMDAAEHDRLLASVSHLPHVLAFALVAQIAGQPDAQRKLSFAGPGFRDFTRIAAGSPAMWRDIALANRAAIGQELRALVSLLQRVEQALAAGDAQWLQQLFDLASRTRRRMNGGGDGP
ncbi:MAG TPA: prephenate dehydrogenase/arogenate dehydrogenase family protein [Burkholderiaceae bacterium]|jgi:prephenate dehydrogenase|nr:prephenate dehydrogenase/arogenate dehydrogenase family protein [Burkholderiaceae bacterium]